MALPKIETLIGAPINSDPWDAAYDALYDGALKPATTTQFAVAADSGARIVFTGNFTVTGGEVTDGTVTGFKVFMGASQTIAGRGYALSATAVVDAIKTVIDTDDDDPFWELFWQRPLNQVGSRDDDEMWGTSEDGTIDGGAGNDRIWGYEGAEKIHGGSGHDLLSGGFGLDQLWGGSGRDAFYILDFTAIDRIVDFRPKDDVVVLDLETFDELGPGFVAKSEFRIGKAAATIDQHLIYDRSSGAVYYDPDGAGGATQVKILQMAKNLALTAHDFALFDSLIK